jgi:hypothetical protein
MLVVCRSEYVTVVRTMVDRSILMCNQCVWMHLCHLYLDCVVSNKNDNVCVLPRYKYQMNTDESPVCSFQSDRIKLSLLRNEKTNILQGKNSSSNSSIQSDQMNSRRIFILLLLLLHLLVAVTTNSLINALLLCRWCTRHLVAATHGRGCRSVAATRGRWWRTSQGAARV